LNAAAGFRDQAEVLVKTRAAANLLGATPMDRPEDVEANPASGRIYIVCTRNEQRAAASDKGNYAGREVAMGPDAANPRGTNPWGHIIEIREAGDDHVALKFSWEVFLLAGDPAGGKLITDSKDVRAGIAPASTYFAGFSRTAELSPIGSPDNIGFDPAGNLWMVTDGEQPHGTNNGCYACPTTGPERGRLQQFMSGPVGAEICGCQFSPDGETLFLSIQHPGEGGSVAEPRSHWPDGPGTQPRASVIAVRKIGGGKIGT
jgi:secreted PhoX family phosphatase